MKIAFIGMGTRLRPGQVVVDNSTITFATTIEIAAKLKAAGVGFLDAPVCGMKARANDGTLTVMCSGEPSTFEQVEPLLRYLGSQILYMGASGSGQLTRLINQRPFDISCAALGQIWPTAAKMGLDPDQVGAVSNSGTGCSDASELFLPRSMGISSELLSKQIVGIATSPSQFNNCHRYMPQLAEPVAHGVLAAGGLPCEFATISLGEVFLNPTSRVFRNPMSMDVEEMIRAQPMNAVVPIGGCNKTVPAQLIGAASAGRPAIELVAGPMMTGRYKGERLGACTDCRRFWGKFRAGEIDAFEIQQVERRLATTADTCAVMGTASTMACITEALGVALPGAAAIPAVDAQRLVAAEETGKAAVWLAHNPITPDRIISRESVENAFLLQIALGGSTNAIVHMAAVAGRLGIRVSPDRLNEISDETPVLVDLKPVGEGYMEDLHAAGGVGAVLRELRPLLNLDGLTVEGTTLRQRLDGPAGWVDRKVIRAFEDPVSPVGGLVSLRGSLAPDGAIFERAAAMPSLFEVEGRAVVFEGLEDLSNRIDDPALDVQPNDILVLKNAGPHGAGMPEAGYLPIPSKLARAGVKDMVRISDARMSGTAYGTIVLHVAPEAPVGGPLAAVRCGDRIRLSVSSKRIDLLVDEAEIKPRLAAWTPPPKPARGYAALNRNTVLQSPQGCDLDFLTNTARVHSPTR